MDSFRRIEAPRTGDKIPEIGDEWIVTPPPGSRFQKGGDLYRRPAPRAEMLAPLAWHEAHMATAYRYGELADGAIGHRRVK